MSEVLLSNRQLNPEQLIRFCGLGLEELSSCGCAKPSFVAANTPYLVGADASDAAILAQLSPPRVASRLTSLSLTLGSDRLLPLAKLRDALHEAGAGAAVLGEAANLSHRRGGQFVQAVKGYQQALLDYRKAVGANVADKMIAKQAAQYAFDEMQRQFRNELTSVTAQIKARRGTPLTNAQRGTNIATSGRDVTKLYVASQIEANIFVKLTRHAKVLGGGLALIDFGARIGSVTNEFNAGGGWHRRMFIESSSFLAAALTASLAIKGGLGLLVLATPFGWVGLLLGGVAIAGVAAGSSLGMNAAIESNAGAVYDFIMKELGTL